MFILAYLDKSDWVFIQSDLSLSEAKELLSTSDHETTGIFKQRPGWSEYRPRYLKDNRDKSSWPICNLGGLINSLESDWF